MPSTRRTFLAGAVAGLAGCTAAPRRSGTAANTPVPTTTDPGDSTLDFVEPATIGDLRVRPTDATVQHSYVALVHPDFADVVAREGRQFLFVTVDARGSPAPSAGDFSVVAGDATSPGQPKGNDGRPYREERRYSTDAGHGWLLYELPAPVEADRVALELDVEAGETATWNLPEDVVARLRGPPPAFEVRDVEAPDSVRPDEPIEVSVTVANVGDGAGTFRGSLNQEGDLLYGSDTFSFDLAAGAERAWSETVTTHRRVGVESQEAVRLPFRSAGGDADRDVVVQPPETATS